MALIAVGLATGIFNAVLIRGLKLPSIIATLGTFSILEGASLLLRDHPEGPISSDAISGLTTSVGFPVAFVAVVVLAVLADVWLYRTRTGLAARAVGLDETSSRRLGMATGRIVILAFVICSVMASLAGFYLAAQVQIGSPLIGNFGLESIAAVLGGAALSGGKGSFVGTLLAALFLSLIDNVLPLFHQPTEYSQITIGVLILLALVLYQSPELLGRLRSQGRRRPRSRPAREKRRQATLVRNRARRRRNVVRGSASRPMTTQIAWTGSSPTAHSRCGEDESKAIEPPGRARRPRTRPARRAFRSSRSRTPCRRASSARPRGTTRLRRGTRRTGTPHRGRAHG